MALTRPKLSHNIDTDSSVFTDPILVLHQSATSANVDSGFLFNRANGLVSNVAIYWSESANSFVTAFTTNAGSSNSNISVSMYANLRTGILTSNSITNSGTLVIGNTGDVSANIGSFYTYANATFATVSGTSSGIDANLGAFQTYANTKIGTNNNGNLVVAALTQSTSTTTGALVVGGGAAVGGNLYVGGNLIVSNVVYQNSEIITTTELVQGNMIAASSAVSTSTTTGALVVIGGAGIGGALYITNTGDVSANIGAYQTYANANVTAIQANLGAYQTYANANVVAIQANIGAYQTYANANVVAIQANLGAYQTYANANIATIQANIGAYQTYANANVVAIQANLGAYQTFANSNAATQATSIDTINANIGAYQTYANANVVAIQANLGAYQTYANANVVAIQANLGAYQTYANANVVAIQANLGAFQVFSNANAATQAISINSIVTNANANTAAYLLTATGNINAGNITTSGTSGNISGVNYIFASNYVYANGVSIFSGTYSNTNVEAYIGGNIGAFQIFSNANAATQATSINTINANIGAYQTYANANVVVIQANLGAYQTYSNANVAAIQANIGAFYNYANTKIGTNTDSNLVINSTTESYGTTSGALVVKGGAGIVGNLWVAGNIYVANLISIASSTLSVQDPLLYLTASSLSPYNYDIGFYSQFVGGSLNNYQHTGFSRDVNTSTWTLFSNVFAEPGITINWTEANIVFDPIKVGSANIANTTVSTSTTTGALVVGGGVGVAGNVYANRLYTTNGLFWSGNGSAFSSGLTISEINSANALSNISTSVTSIRFDRDTGFSVVELDPGNVKVSLGSSFKTWHVPGQADLVAVAEDEVTFFGNSIDITTNPTAPKSITFATNLAGYTSNIAAGNITVTGNIRTGALYTTNGLYWAGNGVSINVSTLNDLSDVIIDTPLTNHVLKYDGTKWINGTSPGGGGGGGITYTAGVSPPGGPNVGDQWYDTANDVLYEYLDDGTSQYWIDVQSQGQVGNIISVSDATLSGNIVVGVDNRYSIGAPSGYLKNIYANTIVGNIATIGNLAGNTNITGITTISNTTNSVPYIMGSGAFYVAGGISIGKDIWVGGNLYVANIISQTSSILEVADPLVYLNSNSATYNYDIGIFSEFTGGPAGINAYTGMARSYSTNQWNFFSNVKNIPTNGQINFSDTGIIWDTIKAGSILPGANLTYNIGSSTNWYNTIYGVATQAQYADLAERYKSDADYNPGTVVVFGGEYEITISTKDHDSAVAGVISTNPAYLMNAIAEGLPVALQGRAPCQVQGPIHKGELVVSSNVPGVAQRFIKERFEHGCIIGKSLENINDDTIKTIEVVVGRY
jgi:hypothetical protein